MEKDSSEIAKLTERIAKDPKSKLFVPLAEEHKKAGNIEMAVSVLQEGLRNNPSYVTARSFLGRLLMETGDLAGAQKELEEVIKSIPDNLLAQRKLADLYVYQGRSSDALQRYRAALALNPGDKELPSLIADLEAGKDIASRLPKIKAGAPAAEAKKAQPAAPAAAAPPRTPAAAAATAKPAAPATPAAASAAKPNGPAATAAAAKPAAPATPKAAAPSVAPAAAEPAPKAAPPKPAAAVPPSSGPKAVPPAGPAQKVPAPAAEPAEAVEEIIELEPAQPAAARRPPAAAARTAPAEAPATAPMPAEVPAALKTDDIGAAAVASFDLSEPDLMAQQPVPGATAWEPPAEAQEAIAEPAASREPEMVSPPEEMPAVPSAPKVSEVPGPAPVVAAPQEPADDINTSTLAELYITQGFFEKAIEIYEGMLAEKPDNAALQQKLEKIRAMAGVAERNAAFAVPAAVPAEDGASTDVFAAAADQEAASDEAPPVGEPKAPEPAVTSAIERPAERTPTAERIAPRAPQASAARRKETIDRLESWLKNVIKEKP